MDSFFKFTEAFTRLISTVVWPLVVLVVLLSFSGPLKDFLSNMQEGTLKAAGVEFSGKRRSDAATAIVQATQAKLAADAKADPKAPVEPAGKVIANAIKTAEQVTNDISLRTAQSKRILWVDDKPTNNQYEKEAFEALGLQVTDAVSTDAALALLQRQKYDLIISDMDRPEGARAGYDLLAKIKEQKITTPLIFYSGSVSAGQRAEAQKAGAFASTNFPDELVRFAAQALKPH
jgi:CheY-like chemotaxis protein